MSELPSGWEWTTIGEIANVQLGRQRSPKNHSGLHMRPYLRSANVTWSGIDISDVKQMNFEPGEASTFELQPGDLLLNEASGSPSEVGKPAIWRGEIEGCCFQNTLLRVRPRRVSTGYLYWYCRAAALSGRFGEASRGVNIRHLGKQGLAAFPLALPPLSEQERIVAAIEEHLSRLDAAESVLTFAQGRVAALAQAGTRQLLESRPWPWTTLGEIAEIKGGVTKDSKRQSDPSFVEVPYLRVANVQRGRLDLSEVSAIRVHPDKAKALRLEPGDVLLNEGGDRDKLGRGWVWEGQVKDCIHQNHVFRARLNDDFDPYFVSTHANTWGQAWFEEHGRQTTNLASINLGTLKRLPVPAPPRSEQEAIVAELQASSEAQKRLLASIDHAESRARVLSRSILGAAFSGQLVPHDPDDEPASMLLNRIRAERAAVTRKATAS
jgi:type I restriction enzyme S subunit